MKKISTIADLLELLGDKKMFPESLILFRGQPVHEPLLPTICRYNPSDNAQDIEVTMLEELKRRTTLLVKENLKDDWDWLIYAQHFGMKTTLLDWTSNPLVALWFAISQTQYIKHPSYLFTLNVVADDYLLEVERKKGPFRAGKTKILKPTLNNARIIAQQGWFTTHLYSNSKEKYIPLDGNTTISPRIRIYEIDQDCKLNMLDELNTLGINYQSLFPDVTGVTRQINWEFLEKKFETQ
jgi:FRG domain